QAETYKWVDDKGRVNYSNAPPPSAGKAKQVQAVEDRVSVYQTDPAYERYLRQRAEQITARQEAEWRERQQYLAAAQPAYTPMRPSYPDYYSGYGYSGYFYPAYVVGTRTNRNHVVHHGRTTSPVRVSHHGGSRGGRR